LNPTLSAVGIYYDGTADGRGQCQLLVQFPKWENGMKAGYILNMAQNPRVRLKSREGLRARWHTGTAHLLSDDDPRERQRWDARRSWALSK
jgi:hypothetical protein